VLLFCPSNPLRDVVFALHPMATDSPVRHTRRWYWPHHFVVLPLALLLAFYAGRHYAGVAGDDSAVARLWFTVALLAAAVVGVVLLMRQHYALGLQDRVIRLEVRQRYFELTGRSFRPLEARLPMGRITALRFAPDEQLPALAEAAVAENLSSATIIERIGAGYQPDTLRL
jgi:hypothetical protein